MRIKDFVTKNKYLLMLGIFAVALIVPISVGTMIHGHDILFHMGRIECVADNIALGKWFAPMYYKQLDGYGYAAPLYYGDLFLYIPGFVRYLGASINFSMRLFLVIIFVATIFISYRCFYLISKNKTGAFVATVIYAFSPYFAADLLLRIAVGEAQAFVFLPIIALGFYSIVFEDSKYWLCLPLGLSACLFSHTLSAVIAVAFLGIFSIFSIKQFIQNKKRIGYILVSALLFFAITAVYTIPLIEQISTSTFYLTSGSSVNINGPLALSATPWKFLFVDVEVVKVILQKLLRTKIEVCVPCGLGLAPILCIFGLIFAWKKASKKAIVLIGVAFATSVICTKIFPWDVFQKVLGIIQFPWRLYIIVVMLFGLGAMFLLPAFENERLRRIVAGIIVSLGLFSFFTSGCFNIMFDEPSAEQYQFKNYIASAEFLPVDKNTNFDFWSSTNYYLNRGEKISSNNLAESDAEFERQEDVLAVTYKNNQGTDTYLDLPLIMYKGYRAIDGDGNNLPINYGDNSVLRVKIGDKQEGSIKVWYEGTTLYKISRIITILALASTFAYMILRKRKAKLNK